MIDNQHKLFNDKTVQHVHVHILGWWNGKVTDR